MWTKTVLKDVEFKVMRHRCKFPLPPLPLHKWVKCLQAQENADAANLLLFSNNKHVHLLTELNCMSLPVFFSVISFLKN